jgi:hypothetical protein
MFIIDDGGLKLKCDKCRAPLDADALPVASVPVVGVHGEVRVFHTSCAGSEYQFLTASAARQMTLVAMFQELIGSCGILYTDLAP